MTLPLKTSFFTLHIALGFACACAAAGIVLAEGVPDAIQLETFKTHSRLIFKIDDGVETDVKATAKGFEILFKGIGLADLGAPLGEEDAWKTRFQGIQDERVDRLQFAEVPGGLKVTGRWKFAAGKQAPADPRMETFDYREKSPGSWVLDFWPKQGPTVAEIQASKARKLKADKIREAEMQTRERAARHLASEKARAEAEDTLKFCRMPLAEGNDVFLQFLPVHDKPDFSRWLPATTPDSDYRYFEPEGKERDAQYVRLALDLYRQGKPALVVRTLDFLDSEQPGSNYRQEMRFLRANALIKLGMQDEANRVLQSLLTEAKDSPVALYAGMYLARMQMARGSSLEALESFLWLIEHHPEHRFAWVFHLGSAEALYALKQTERAAKEYQWVTENGPDDDAKAEAALRLGDLYLDRLQHDQALAAYFQGLNHFKDRAQAFPSLVINRAEALYGLGQYDRAKEAFAGFLKSFPAHPAGWRAAFRLGEIEGRAKAGSEESRKWFYETVNRYPFSPGATLARLRLVPCGDHGGFDADSAERFFTTEAAKFDSPEIAMARYRDFRGLAHIRALIAFGREQRAVEVAAEEIQGSGNSAARPIMTATLETLFRKTILKLLEDGKKYEALAFYHDKNPVIRPEGYPAPAPAISEPDYLLRLSEAASDLGLGKLGQQLADFYAKATAASDAGAGRAPASVAEPQDLETELKAAEKHFSEGKSLWIQSGPLAEDKIRRELDFVNEQSPFSYEKEIILGLLDEKNGKVASALEHGVKAQLLAPMGKRELRLDAWIARLQTRAGDPKVALSMLQEVQSRIEKAGKIRAKQERGPAEALGVPPAPEASVILAEEGAILEKQGRWSEAALTYERAMDRGRGGNEAVYEYARALLRTGARKDRARAIAALEKLSDSKTEDFWKRLASETLADEKSRQVSSAKEGAK